MNRELRVVFDTGVIVSAALLPDSVPRRALEHALAQGTLLLSEPIVLELNEVFRRRKFDKYVDQARRLEFLATLIREATLLDVTASVTDCRDPKDNKFLELALSSFATHVVSSDQDLLVLHPFRGISIVTPKTFLSVADNE